MFIMAAFSPPIRRRYSASILVAAKAIYGNCAAISHRAAPVPGLASGDRRGDRANGSPGETANLR
jgi:hypothetical protein